MVIWSQWFSLLTKQFPPPLPHGVTAPCGPGPSPYRGCKIALSQHSRWDSFGRLISPTQSPLPDDTQHSQETLPSAGFEPTILKNQRPQTHALDRVATGIGTKQS